ncbi:unnamed protein product [Linum trigynum]|uniref:Secreted protein n=1 Tax=Linum trigynum TaxID=586398 RepID=A0AAV2FTJ3_9ROSI
MWRDALASLMDFYHFVGRSFLSFLVAILQAAITNQDGARRYRSTTARHGGGQPSARKAVLTPVLVCSPKICPGECNRAGQPQKREGSQTKTTVLR